MASAWAVAVRFLSTDEQVIVGVLSDPGPEQRLTVIPEQDDVVVKLAVHPGGDALIERERACLAQLPETPWAAVGPRLRHDGRTSSSARAVLLMDRAIGRHPSWDDSRVHRDVLRALSPAAPGDGLCHGDVTPWNTIQTPDGSLTLVDWEFADLSVSTAPLNGLLDFIVRGAVVARARPRRIRPLLCEAVSSAGLDRNDSTEILRSYRAYRSGVERAMGDRSDSLSRRADRVLAACLPGGRKP